MVLQGLSRSYLESIRGEMLSRNARHHRYGHEKCRQYYQGPNHRLGHVGGVSSWSHLPTLSSSSLSSSFYSAAATESSGELDSIALNDIGKSAEAGQLIQERNGKTYLANLLVKCPDAKGVVASVSQLLYGFNCNIISSDQFSDLSASPPQFYQRIVLDYSDALVGPGNVSFVLERGLKELAQRYNMEWSISYLFRPKKVAILVSRLDHCLYDLLIRHESGELDCEIPIVISNWPDLRNVASKFGIDFKHLPVTAETKASQEAEIESLLEEYEIDIVVLARYMQIFSKSFAERNWSRVINVHHGFLPAFQGAKPYHRAHERGVKLIGATAHFATSELDCGPIIAQDTVQVTHRDTIADMIRKGRDLERLVLARALRWSLDDRIIVTNDFGKTVVFED